MTSMVMSASVDKLAPALLKAQTQMSNATKGSQNPFFKSQYADLNAVREASQPALNENGFTVLQPMVQKEGKSYVRTLLLHESGQYIGSDTEVVVKNASNPQDYGSGVSYARRYGLQALVSLGQQDDDGEAAVGREKPSKPLISQPAKTEETPKTNSTFRKPGVKANGASNGTAIPASPEGWD